MQVSELIELLESMDEEAEVRLAFQPNYPLAFEIGNVVATEEFEAEIDEDSFEGFHAHCDGYGFGSYCPECDEFEDKGPDHDTRGKEAGAVPGVVWITEGGHPTDDSPYAPRDAFSSGNFWS